MPTKKLSLIAKAIAPEDVGLEGAKYLPLAHFEHLKFWENLETKDQTELIEQSHQLVGQMIVGASNRLAQGEHLCRIRDILKPHPGALSKYLSSLHYTPRSAYRNMAAFENIAQRVPRAVLHAAIARGMELVSHNPERPLGVYTEAARLLPPPTNPSTTAANKYLDQLEQTALEQAKHRRSKKVPEPVQSLDPMRADPKFLMIQSFRNVKNNFAKVPKRRQKQWLATLFGTLLTQAGYSSPTMFEPEGIPEEFNQGRGRPKLVEGNLEESDLQEAVG
jgi:hypothetical protein